MKKWLKGHAVIPLTTSYSIDMHALHSHLTKRFLAADAAAKAKGQIVRVEDAQIEFDAIRDIVKNAEDAARMVKGTDGEGRASKAPMPDLVINEVEETIMYSSVAQARKAVVSWEAEEERRRRKEEERRRREEQERRRWLPCRC